MRRRPSIRLTAIHITFVLIIGLGAATLGQVGAGDDSVDLVGGPSSNTPSPGVTSPTDPAVAEDPVSTSTTVEPAPGTDTGEAAPTGSPQAITGEQVVTTPAATDTGNPGPTIPGGSSGPGVTVPVPGPGSTTTTTAPPVTAPPTTATPVPPPPRPVTPAPGPAHYDGQPSLTKLRLTLRSEVPWAVARLDGVQFVQAQVVSSSPGALVTPQPDGMSVHGIAGGTGVVDLVLQLPGGDVPTWLCKSSGGSASLTVTRITGEPFDAVALTTAANDDVIVDACANSASEVVPNDHLAPEGAWPVPVDDRRLVLSFFFPMWDAHTFDDPSKYIEVPYPPYDTTSDTEVAAMIRQAQGAGVDGFVINYQDVAPLEGRYERVVRMADATTGFTVAPVLELAFLRSHTSCRCVPTGTLEQWFRNVLAPSDGPSFLRVDGRPVVFIFDLDSVRPDQLRHVRSNLRASGLDPYVIGDAGDVPLRVFEAYELDGLYSYSPNVIRNTDELQGWHWHHVLRARLTPERGLGDDPILWAGPVSPGEDDRKAIPGASLGVTLQREDGARYDRTWQQALTARPEWVLVTSWNAFPEATQIQPGNVWGTRALEQTAAWNRTFKAG